MTEDFESMANDTMIDIEAVGRIPAIASILEVICKTTGMGFAAVARVTETKWVACAVKDRINFGLVPGGELPLKTTICNEIRQHKKVVAIDDVIEDALYAHHPTPAIYGFQSYISVPIIRKNGIFFGTLCAIDPKPHLLNRPDLIDTFRLFADLISFHLENVLEVEQLQKKLLDERKTAELREQFVAVLGHDLRSPVAAVSSVAAMLLRMPLDERTARLAHILQDCSYRMKKLIENVLDFARGRMGEGIMLSCLECSTLPQTILQVIAELRLVHPQSLIQTEIDVKRNIYCDENRIAQLFSNLLGNALTHGSTSEPVRVKLTNAEDAGVILSICNSGSQIPKQQLEGIFQPFFRGAGASGQQGLGLGLYIASEIAKAHGGSLEVQSDEQNTCFTFRLPAA